MARITITPLNDTFLSNESPEPMGAVPRPRITITPIDPEPVDAGSLGLPQERTGSAMRFWDDAPVAADDLSARYAANANVAALAKMGGVDWAGMNVTEPERQRMVAEAIRENGGERGPAPQMISALKPHPGSDGQAQATAARIISGEQAPERSWLDSLYDTGKVFNAGIHSGVGNAIGYGIEAAGEKTGLDGAADFGAGLRRAEQAAGEKWLQSLSPEGREMMKKQLFDGFKPNLDDQFLGSLVMKAVQSAPGMVVTAPVGGAIAKGIGAIGGAVLPEVAGALISGTASPIGRTVIEAAKTQGLYRALADRALSLLPSSIGYGAAEGGIAGLQNAAQLRTDIEGMDPNQLYKTSSTFRKYVESNNGDVAAAQKQLARDAAGDVALRTTLSTGAIGILTGGGAMGMLSRQGERQAAEGIIKSAVKGGAEEWLQETPQSGGEAYIENVARRDYLDPTINPMDGVLSQAMEGGAVGMASGMGLGLGGGIVNTLAGKTNDPNQPITSTGGAATETGRQAEGGRARTEAGRVFQEARAEEGPGGFADFANRTGGPDGPDGPGGGTAGPGPGPDQPMGPSGTQPGGMAAEIAAGDAGNGAADAPVGEIAPAHLAGLKAHHLRRMHAQAWEKLAADTGNPYYQNMVTSIEKEMVARGLMAHPTIAPGAPVVPAIAPPVIPEGDIVAQPSKEALLKKGYTEEQIDEMGPMAAKIAMFSQDQSEIQQPEPAPIPMPDETSGPVIEAGGGEAPESGVTDADMRGFRAIAESLGDEELAADAEVVRKMLAANPDAPVPQGLMIAISEEIQKRRMAADGQINNTPDASVVPETEIASAPAGVTPDESQAWPAPTVAETETEPSADQPGVDTVTASPEEPAGPAPVDPVDLSGNTGRGERGARKKSRPPVAPETPVVPESAPEPEITDVSGNAAEVSVPMPEAEEKGLAPKQQKSFLLQEIDTAIAAELEDHLKEFPESNMDGMLSTWKQKPMGSGKQYTFDVPGDGEYTIYASKLAEFKEKIRKDFPTGPEHLMPGPSRAGLKNYAAEAEKFSKIAGDTKKITPSQVWKLVADTSSMLGWEKGDVIDTKKSDKEAVHALTTNFLNWLLQQDITPEVREEIRKGVAESVEAGKAKEQDGQKEISDRVKQQNEAEVSRAAKAAVQRLLTAPKNEKDDIAKEMTKDHAEAFLRWVEAAPGDDMDGRAAIYRAFPDLAPREGLESTGKGEKGSRKRASTPKAQPQPKDILQEIADISDDDLDALVDGHEEARPRSETDAPTGAGSSTFGPKDLVRDRGAVIPKKATTKDAAKALEIAAKHGVEGAAEAWTGIYELFGGGSLKSFPGGMDEDTYAKAKPHFQAALDHCIETGKSIKEFVAIVLEMVGDAARPYLKRFIREIRDGQSEDTATDKTEDKTSDKPEAKEGEQPENTDENDTSKDDKPTDKTKGESDEETPVDLTENTGKGEKGARRKLTDQEKAEKEAKKKAAEEKKAKKAGQGNFQNIGYVWDPTNIEKKIKDKSPKSAITAILDEMAPAKVWRMDFPEGASPGFVRLHGMFTKTFFRTFKDFLKEGHLNAYANWRGQKGFNDVIARWLGSDESRHVEKAYLLRQWAREYGEIMQPVIDAFRESSNIAQAVDKLKDLFIPHVTWEDGKYPDKFHYLPEDQRAELNAFDRDVLSDKKTLYAFLAGNWENLLADEQDILLSDIDPHKRGRNKTVVRVGLPEHGSDQIKSTEAFNKPFVFNGVGFGTEGWINQDERNRVVPAAYNAFMDLMAAIKAPHAAAGLGKQLAVQFANLGHKAKGAAACYFPSERTINFTRDSGDGTMSHEWFHAFHALAGNPVIDEINNLIRTYKHVYDFEAGGRMADNYLAKDSPILKRLMGGKQQSRIEAVKKKISQEFADVVRKETAYYKTAQMIDSDYTANNQEMGARAFEAFIFDTLPGKNNYLVSDFVAAGRVGGASRVGSRLVYPAGVERQQFNADIQYFIDGLVWSEDGLPSLKEGYQSLDARNEERLQKELADLLATVEARYKAIWASEPSADGLFWYQYDETGFGPMLQPDGYSAHDKTFKAEGQNGTGAVAYLTQLHPDDILDYKLTSIQYAGDSATYIKGGTKNDGFSADGEEALDEVSSESNSGPKEGGDLGEPDGGDGPGSDSGTVPSGPRGGSTRGGEGTSDPGVSVSAPGGNYRITDEGLNDPRPVAARFLSNLSAVKVLKLIEDEGRPATPAEKEVLAQYSGWGGMSELFSYYPSAAWAEKSRIIKALLTDAEIEGAERSSTTAYYSPVAAGQFIWQLAQRLGFTNGLVLDPAFGANGLFLGTMPADLGKAVTMHGVEMDDLSARIASVLYEDAKIEHAPFQDVVKPLNRFDMTLTNVPFNANVVPADSRHNKQKFTLHNFFINKMLNLTAQGGLSIMITSSNTMDETGPHLAEFSKKADLVGAIRLPSGIYSATDVSTDILVFRKKIPGSKFVGIPAETWTTTGTFESTGLSINKYFLEYPEMIAGKLEAVRGRWGADAHRVIAEGDLAERLARIADAFPGDIVEREVVKAERPLDEIIPAPGTVKEGGLYINDKKQVCEKREGEEFVWPNKTPAELKKIDIAAGYIKILGEVFTVLRAGRTLGEADIAAAQTNLRRVYDIFVKKHGPVNNPKNIEVYGDATDAAWVTTLEEYDPDTQKVVRLADVFTKNISQANVSPTTAETDEEALGITLNEFGYPNLDHIAKLRGSDVDTVLKSLSHKIIENPETGLLETFDQYLSGNVRAKLAVAREMAKDNPEYDQQVRLLEAHQPIEIPPDRITARIGATWLKPKYLEDFVHSVLNMPRQMRVIFNYNPATQGKEWTMTFSHQDSKAETGRALERLRKTVEARSVWGTSRMDFIKIMENILLGKTPVVTSPNPTGPGRVVDREATEAAQNKANEIQAHFQNWIFEDADRAEDATQRFNEIVNTSVPPKVDGSHLTLPGKSMYMLTQKEADALGVSDAKVYYPHQLNSVWKYITKGNSYLAHGVGLGKTATMITLAMEARRLRGKKKVVYVTLNDSTFGQAVAEAKQLYPMANVMPVRVSTDAARKNRELYKLALNDFDIAIMRQQDLDRIGISPEAENVFIEEDLRELREILEKARQDGARILERDIQTRIEALEQKLREAGVHDEAKRKNLFFDDLGIDLLIVDEAHAYKNVPYATRMTQIMGLNPAGSPTAQAFFRKTQFLNAQYPKQDAVVLASGTPLTNSLAEMYNIQRMLQPREVKTARVWSFDRWAANFANIGGEMEWDAINEQYKAITQIRQVVNAGRMLAVAYQNIDSVQAKDTPVKRPVIAGGEPHRVVVKPNPYVMDYKDTVAVRAAAIERDPKNAMWEGVHDNALRLYSNLSDLAIDQRLLKGAPDPNGPKGSRLPGPYADTELQADSKITACRDIVFRRWQEEAKHKGVQLIFADRGTPKDKSRVFKEKSEEALAKMSSEQQEAYAAEKYAFENEADGLFNSYDGLTQELVKKGIPRNQIAYIHDADDVKPARKEAKLRKLFKQINAGEIRILIGSTTKAGTGVNIQGRVSDVHHLDVWWNYSAWEQRNGRGIRAGNIYANEGMPGVHIWNYVTETTVDATRWDKVFAKGRVLNAVLDGDINVDILEDIGEEVMQAKMIAANASGNPLMATQAVLLQEVQKLRFAQTTFLNTVRRAAVELSKIPDEIAAAERTLAGAQKSADLLGKVTAVRFVDSDETLVLGKHAKEIAEGVKARMLPTHGKEMNGKARIPLLVFGTHTETEVTETVEVPGKPGEKPIQKEKKVKKYTFTPLPVQGDMTGSEIHPFRDRQLLIHGAVTSTVNRLGDFMTVYDIAWADGGRKMTPAEEADHERRGKVKGGYQYTKSINLSASVNRSLGAAREYVAGVIQDQKEKIEDRTAAMAPLEKLTKGSFPKAAELEAKTKELAEIDRQITASGQTVANAADGLPIKEYRAQIPAMDDVAEKDAWMLADGVIYPRGEGGGGEGGFAVRAPIDQVNNLFLNAKTKFSPQRLPKYYDPPEGFRVLNDGPPGRASARPVAYSTESDMGGVKPVFWVGVDAGFGKTTYLKVDPVKFQLLERLLPGGSWHYESFQGDHYLVHQGDGQTRNGYMLVERETESRVPQGVRDIVKPDGGAGIRMQRNAGDEPADAEWHRRAEEVLAAAGSVETVYLNDRDFDSALAQHDPGSAMMGNSRTTAFVSSLTNKIYIRRSIATKSAIFHEYAHLVLDRIRKENPDLFAQGAEKVKGSVYEEWAKQHGYKAHEIEEEALAQAIADKGAKIQDRAIRKPFYAWLRRIWHEARMVFKKAFNMDITFDEWAEAVAGGMRTGRYRVNDELGMMNDGARYQRGGADTAGEIAGMARSYEEQRPGWLRRMIENHPGVKAWNFLSKQGPEWAGEKSDLIDKINGAIITGYREDAAFSRLRKDHENRLLLRRQKASELARILATFPDAEQARIGQIIEGSVTMAPKRYAAALKVAEEFQALEAELQELGLLGADNRFRQMSRKEIAKVFKEIDGIGGEIARLEKQLQPKVTTKQIAEAKAISEEIAETVSSSVVAGSGDVKTKIGKAFAANEARVKEALSARGFAEGESQTMIDRIKESVAGVSVQDGATTTEIRETITRTITQTVATVLETTKTFSPGYMARARASINRDINDLRAKQVKLLERVRLHYKMAGKQYLRMAYDTIENDKTFLKHFRNAMKYHRLRRGYNIQRKDYNEFVRKEKAADLAAAWRAEHPGKSLDAKTRLELDAQAVDAAKREMDKWKWDHRLAAPVLALKGMSEEAHDAEMMRLFTAIAENPEWSADEAGINGGGQSTGKGVLPYAPTDMHRWKRLQKSERLGPLSGRWVRPEIYDYLDRTMENRTAAGKVYDEILRLWKTGKVVFNPAAQVRNILSNIILANMAGVGFHRVDVYMQAAKEMKAKGAMWKDAEQAGLFGVEWAGHEIASFLDGMEALDPKKGSIFKDPVRLAKTLLAAPGKSYQGIEQYYKFVIFANERRKGRTITEAKEHAEKWLFNYTDIPKAIRWAKRWYSPFITFTYKAMPRFVEIGLTKPWKLAEYWLLMAGVELLTRTLRGESDDDQEREERVLPAYMRREVLPGRINHLRVPYTDEHGRSKYLDLSYILPWGDVGEQWGQSSITMIPRSFLPSHPVIVSGAEIAFNEVLFTGEELRKSWMTNSDYAKAIGANIWRSAMPSLAPGGFGFNKLMSAATGDKDWAGRDRSMEEAIFDTVLGLKVRSIDYTEERTRRMWEAKGEINDIKEQFRRDWRQITVQSPDDDPEKQAEREKDLYAGLNERIGRVMEKVREMDGE